MLKKLSCGLLALTMAFNGAPALIGNSISSTNFGAVGVAAAGTELTGTDNKLTDGATYTLSTAEITGYDGKAAIDLNSYFTDTLTDTDTFTLALTEVGGVAVTVPDARLDTTKAELIPDTATTYKITATWTPAPTISEPTTELTSGEGESDASATILVTVDAELTSIKLTANDKEDSTTITTGANATLAVEYLDQFVKTYSYDATEDGETVYTVENDNSEDKTDAGFITGSTFSTNDADDGYVVTATITGTNPSITDTVTIEVVTGTVIGTITANITAAGTGLKGSDVGAITFTGNGESMTATVADDGKVTLQNGKDLYAEVDYVVSVAGYSEIVTVEDDFYYISGVTGSVTFDSANKTGALALTVTEERATASTITISVNGLTEGTVYSIKLSNSTLGSYEDLSVEADEYGEAKFSVKPLAFGSKGMPYTVSICDGDGYVTQKTLVVTTAASADTFTYTAATVPEEEYVAPEASDDETPPTATEDVTIEEVTVTGDIAEVGGNVTPPVQVSASSFSEYTTISPFLTIRPSGTGDGRVNMKLTGLDTSKRLAVFRSANGVDNWQEISISLTAGAAATMSNGIISPATTVTSSSRTLSFAATANYYYTVSYVPAASTTTTTTGGSYTSATYHDSGSVRVNGSYITELRNVLVGELVNLSKITTVNGQEVTGWYYDSAMTKEITNPSQFVVTSSVIGDGIYARTSGTTVVPDSYVDGSTNAGTGTTTAPETTYQPSVVPSTVAKLLSKLF